jgi:hypothetical protein
MASAMWRRCCCYRCSGYQSSPRTKNFLVTTHIFWEMGNVFTTHTILALSFCLSLSLERERDGKCGAAVTVLLGVIREREREREMGNVVRLLLFC